MSDPLSIRIRPLTSADESLLWTMVYHAIYLPENAVPLPLEVVHHPKIAKYVEDWGRTDDVGFVAVDTTVGQPIGAAWARLLKGEEGGYGYVNDETPELTVALLPGYRGQGIGSELMIRLLDAARERYPAISLSVSPENPALRLYRRLGFEVVGRSGTSLTMVKRWGERNSG
ncbi:MAG: GNAT family N-acetyltransferase [Chloroflexota bacterium]|nr:GNAT family N-acetyltransferase [Chloroflexota bacterium]